MSIQAVILRNQRSKSKQQTPSTNNVSIAVDIERKQSVQQEQQQLKMLKAMKLASQEDHRYYASVEKTASVQFPQAAIKAMVVSTPAIRQSRQAGACRVRPSHIFW